MRCTEHDSKGLQIELSGYNIKMGFTELGLNSLARSIRPVAGSCQKDKGSSGYITGGDFRV